MNDPQTCGSIDNMKPSERFAHLAKTVFSVSPEQVADQEARSQDEKPARKHGPPKGTPNRRTKRKLAMEQPTT
jgi:hypothetical protein